MSTKPANTLPASLGNSSPTRKTTMDSPTAEPLDSPSAFHHAPILQSDGDDSSTSGDAQRKKSRMHGVLRVLGLSCLLQTGKGSRKRAATTGTDVRDPLQSHAHPKLKAARMEEDPRIAYMNRPVDDDMSSVYSSQYDGEGGSFVRDRDRLQFVLYGGSERVSHYQPLHSDVLDSLQGPIEYHSLRRSFQERNHPVFFTPPPVGNLPMTPGKLTAMHNYSPVHSPTAAAS